MDRNGQSGQTSKLGRPPERIRLHPDQLAGAKESLENAEKLLASSAKEFSRLIGVSPKTWRSYKDPNQPGPTPQIVYEIDRLLADLDSSDHSLGELAQKWELDPTVLEPPTEGASTPEPPAVSRRILAFGGLAAIVAVIAPASWWLLGGDDEPEAAAAVIEIYNKVVLDESQMREDTPAYLTTSADCVSFSNCGVEGTSFISGDTLEAVCQIDGLEVTNRFGDTENPENFDSTLWYGVQHEEGFGYISEVWVHVRDRGGKELRLCEPTG